MATIGTTNGYVTFLTNTNKAIGYLRSINNNAYDPDSTWDTYIPRFTLIKLIEHPVWTSNGEEILYDYCTLKNGVKVKIGVQVTWRPGSDIAHFNGASWFIRLKFFNTNNALINMITSQCSGGMGTPTADFDKNDYPADLRLLFVPNCTFMATDSNKIGNPWFYPGFVWYFWGQPVNTPTYQELITTWNDWVNNKSYYGYNKVFRSFSRSPLYATVTVNNHNRYTYNDRLTQFPRITSNFLNYIEAGGSIEYKDKFYIQTNATIPNEVVNSTEGGGEDDFTNPTEAVDLPDLPSPTIGSQGVFVGSMVSAYSPTQAQLNLLGNKLWSTNFFDNIIKNMDSPMEGLINFGLYPFNIPTGGNINCTIGNYDTEISMPSVNSQFVKISGGHITLKKMWGNALDYSPYTEVSIYIPYVGIRTLECDDVMGKTITLEYNVDLFSGSAVASLKCGDSVLYSYSCNMLTAIPITSSNYMGVYNTCVGLVNSAISVGGGVASGNAGAVAGGLTSAYNVATSKKSDVSRGGSISASTGLLGSLTPYLIIRRPTQSLPSNFSHFKGYPSNITRALSSLSGYTEVDSIILDGLDGYTSEEVEEIRTLLQNGVIL